MISRRTSSVPKEDVFPRLLYCDSRCSQTCRRGSQACHRRSHVLPGAPEVLSGALRCSQTYHNHSHGTRVPVIRDPSYSQSRPECPPRVWYSPEIDASKFALHILSDTPGGFQRLRYIVLMDTLTLLTSPTSFQVDKSSWKSTASIPEGRQAYWLHHQISSTVECELWTNLLGNETTQSNRLQASNLPLRILLRYLPFLFMGSCCVLRYYKPVCIPEHSCKVPNILLSMTP